jgi:uncharacterized protein YggE
MKLPMPMPMRVRARARVRAALWGAAACAAALCSSAAWGAEAGASEPPMITVSGEGEVTPDPDHATVRIAIETTASTAASAGQDNARIEKAVREALLQAGATAKDLTTAGFTVQPQWRYHEGSPPQRVGYIARNTLRVDVVKLERVGPYIDAALSAGATHVDDVEFDLKDSDAARRQALTLAVNSAHSDAEAMARAAGGTLGSLRELSSQQQPLARPGIVRAMAAAAPAANAEPTDIRPGPIRISATVLARWEFRPRP